jgi:hypothetical protein
MKYLIVVSKIVLQRNVLRNGIRHQILHFLLQYASVGCSSHIFNCADTFSEFLTRYLDFSEAC